MSISGPKSIEDYYLSYVGQMAHIWQFLSAEVPKLSQLDLVLTLYKGCSARTVIACTCHIFKARPTMGEKEATWDWVEDQSWQAWWGGYCMVDGTLVPLSDKPGLHGKAYFDWKSHYSLRLVVVSMPNLHIIDYVLGPTGSMHDSSSFELSSITQDPQAWFLGHEWIWADSAYGVAPWCIVPYKQPFSLVESNEKFNYYLSQIWIKSEHVMGMLKGCFSSLQGLHQQITELWDHLVLKWIELEVKMMMSLQLGCYVKG
ncbi:hypothetical protein BS47DRAFT_1369579 [Hydnum rufescens UP504]|uniref:DDE Tnp4 domain-containing protein n=1 Tax=Hydnum rufescens UP504 TaxID=1448309 RepID=A0A9P6AD33_9AGAM|nr:hypothetical protein BS47DRAFT_1369579 [Hydnum rufescens UP504]